MLTRPDAPFSFYDPRAADLHAPALPAGLALQRLHVDDAIVAEGLLSRPLHDRGVVDRRHPHAHRSRARGSGGRCCSARTSTRRTTTRRRAATGRALGIGRDVVLDRVIVDKNARIGDGVRLVNEPGIEHADGDRLLHPQHRGGWLLSPGRAATSTFPFPPWPHETNTIPPATIGELTQRSVSVSLSPCQTTLPVAGVDGGEAGGGAGGQQKLFLGRRIEDAGRCEGGDARLARNVPTGFAGFAVEGDDRAFGLAVVGDVDQIVDHDRRLAEAVVLFERADVAVARLRFRRA